MVLAAQVRALIQGIFWNSDVASIPLIAGQLAHRAGGVARVSVANYASSFLFDLATRGLPAHRQLWEVFSLGASLLSVAVLGWAAHRAAGAGAGILTSAIGLCGAPILFYGAYELRGTTWLAAAVAVACLVLLSSLGDRRRRVVVVVTGGLVIGVNLASDPLLLASGVVPVLGAAAAAWVLLRTPESARVARDAVGLVVVAGAGDAATGRLMHALGLRIVPTISASLVPLSRVPHNAVLFGRDLLAFGNERFPGAPSGVVSVAGVVTAALCVAAAVVALRTLVPRARRRGAGDAELARVLYVAFWSGAALVVAGAYAVTPLPGDLTTARYVVPVFFSLAALTGLWAAEAGWERVAACGLATVFCLMSAAGLPRLVTYLRAYPVAAEGPAVVSFLEAKGLRRGYASYWDSLALTWQSGGRVGVYPVQECGTGLCRFGVNVLTTWYRPEVGGRTFIVVGWPVLPLEISNPLPASLGVPEEVDRVGVFTVYIFGNDPGARLG